MSQALSRLPRSAATHAGLPWHRPPAQVDGGAAEQAHRACLRSTTSVSRKPRGATRPRCMFTAFWDASAASVGTGQWHDLVRLRGRRDRDTDSVRPRTHSVGRPSPQGDTSCVCSVRSFGDGRGGRQPYHHLQRGRRRLPHCWQRGAKRCASSSNVLVKVGRWDEQGDCCG